MQFTNLLTGEFNKKKKIFRRLATNKSIIYLSSTIKFPSRQNKKKKRYKINNNQFAIGCDYLDVWPWIWIK